jgi:hypothetical protein
MVLAGVGLMAEEIVGLAGTRRCVNWAARSSRARALAALGEEDDGGQYPGRARRGKLPDARLEAHESVAVSSGGVEVQQRKGLHHRWCSPASWHPASMRDKSTSSCWHSHG